MTDEKIMATIKPDGEYWQPEIETMPREQLEALQVKKLKESINVALKSPFYKKRFGELGITADSINSLADLRKIPFTTIPLRPRRSQPRRCSTHPLHQRYYGQPLCRSLF